MLYKLFMFLALAYNTQALTFENREDFSYILTLGNMEHYLRNGYLEVKECYPKTKEEYENALNNFEKNLIDLINLYKKKDEKDIFRRILKIVKDLKNYNEKLSELLKTVNSTNSLTIANYVDEVREEVKKDHDQHTKNIQEPKPWNKEKFEELETSFRPIRDKHVKEVSKVLEKLAKCVDAPRCD